MQQQNERDVTRTRNGKVRLQSIDQLDGRTQSSRHTLQNIASLTNDAGGVENISEGTRQLIQRAAVLGALTADCEVRWIAGEKINIDAYLAAVNTLKRVLCAIGLARRPRDVTTVDAYVREKYGVQAEAATP